MNITSGKGTVDVKSIQQANIDDDLRYMNEAKARKDKRAFDKAKSDLKVTLDAIRDADRATYEKYVHRLDDEME